MTTEVHVTEKGGWQPVEGETLAGRIIDIDIGEGAYGPYPIVVIEMDTGQVANVHAFHDLLRSKLKSRGAQVGEKVAIIPGARRQGRSGRVPVRRSGRRDAEAVRLRPARVHERAGEDKAARDGTAVRRAQRLPGRIAGREVREAGGRRRR